MTAATTLAQAGTTSTLTPTVSDELEAMSEDQIVDLLLARFRHFVSTGLEPGEAMIMASRLAGAVRPA